MSTDTHSKVIDDIEKLNETRRRRFNDILDGYECGAGDWFMPFGMKNRGIPIARVPVTEEDHPFAWGFKPGRWALVTESNRGHGYFVTSVEKKEDLGSMGTKDLHENWWPVCYYDLDQLAGKPPMPQEGDVVKLVDPSGSYREDLRAAIERGKLYVVGEDTKDGCRTLDLAVTPGGDTLLWAQEDTLEVVEPVEPDPRMPVRYLLAKVVTEAVFNTTPEAP